jgi:hypothetical protein
MPKTQAAARHARTRIIGQLEWLLEAPAGPPAMGIYTWTACWEDLVPGMPAAGDYPPPAFTGEEVAALATVVAAVDAFWDAYDGDDAAGVELPEWAQLCAVAQAALAQLMTRGRLDEDASDL